MSATEYLAGLSRLVRLFSTPASAEEERLAVVRLLVELAQDAALRVQVPREGEPAEELAGGDSTGAVDARALLEGLRLHRVRRLVVRQGATARELAQFAGLLVRTGTDGHEATLAEGLDALRLWSVQLEFHQPDDGSATLPPALLAALEEAAAAPTAAAVAERHAAVRAALEAATAAADPAAAAGCVARALAWLLEAARTRGREWDAALRGAQRAAVEALLEPRLATVVHAVVDGTAPEAWRVVQLAAGRAVPLLINRLGDAATIEERRRCVNALLDAGDGGDALLEGLRDPRWYVVRNVALILGELREPAAVRALARCLQHEDERVREAGAQALTRIDTPSATHALLAGLRAPDASVRRLAARAASRAAEHRVPLAPEVLAARVRIEPDRDVALELVDAVQGIGTPEAWGVLAGLAVHQESAHHDAAVRGAAQRALRRVPPTRLMAALRAHAQGDDVRLRRAAVQAAQLLLARAG